MDNKVESTPETSSSPSLALLNLFKRHINSKTCYHSAPLENAKVTNMNEGCGAYQIDLWTLMEERRLKETHRPYNGEQTPAQSAGDKWAYSFRQPQTVLQSVHKEIRDLEQTRRRVVCSNCHGTGRRVCHSCKGEVGRPCRYCINRPATSTVHHHCSHCQGSRIIRCSACHNTGMVNCTYCQAHGQLLQWTQLVVEWSTNHSTTYQTNTSLPSKVIRDAPGKQTYWSIDQKWSYGESFDNTFRDAFDKQETTYPVKFDEINDAFNKKHMKKIDDDNQIVQVKWDIKKLDIFEIEYELEGYENKKNQNMGNKFRFYYYGNGKNDEPLIYENDYPLNTCGCCGLGCAHYSTCCSIL